MSDSERNRKHASLSDKTVLKEYELTRDEIAALTERKSKMMGDQEKQPAPAAPR